MLGRERRTGSTKAGDNARRHRVVKAEIEPIELTQRRSDEVGATFAFDEADRLVGAPIAEEQNDMGREASDGRD